MPTDHNDDLASVHPGPISHQRDADSPGYETTDVNVNGVAVFLAAA